MQEKIEGLAFEGEEYLTISMAARAVGLTAAAVYKAIERDRLPVRMLLEMQTVTRSDLVVIWPQADPASPTAAVEATP